MTVGWYRVRRHVHVGCLQEDAVLDRQEVDCQEGFDGACEELHQGLGRQEFDVEGLVEGRRERP